MLKTKEERQNDLNPQETSEWLEALDQVVDERVAKHNHIRPAVSDEVVRPRRPRKLFSTSSRSEIRSLELPSRITRWQPQLRMLFITRVALLKYRLQLPGFELPQRVDLAQQEFDEHLAVALDGIADRFKGTARTRTESLQDSTSCWH